RWPLRTAGIRPARGLYPAQGTRPPGAADHPQPARAHPRGVSPPDESECLLSQGRHATLGGSQRKGGRRVTFSRITHNPAVMGGKPCIRGLRVTVGTVLGLLASGESRERILQAYPYLEPPDIDEALAYAAWRLQEREVTLSVA